MPNLVDRIIGDPDVISYSANGNKSQKYDKVSVLNFIRLRLTGTLTLATYSVAPTKLVEAVENIVSQLILNATGSGSSAVSDTIKSIDFAWAHRRTQLMTGTQPARTDISTSNAVYNFESNCTLFLGALDVRALSQLSLQVSWRDVTAMVTGGTGGTATLSNVQIVAHGREVLGLPVAPTRAFIKESSLPYDITATRQDFKLADLPVGNTIQMIGFKGLLGSVDYADPSNTPFANTSRTEGAHIRLKANSAYTVFDYVAGAMQAENKEKFKIETWPAGYYVWLPRVPFNARSAAKLDGFADVNYTGGSTNRIVVYPVELVRK